MHAKALTNTCIYFKIIYRWIGVVYNYKEILEKYKNDYTIRKALNSKEIFKIEKGIYSDKEINNPLVIYSKKYPNAVITMDSAFYYYHLTDVIPNKVYLATDRNAHTIKDDKIIQIFVNKEILYQGRIQEKINNNLINIYDRERLLVEIIRKKKQIPYDYYKEIIRNYRDISYELDMYKIEEYLSLYKNNLNLALMLKNEVF